MQFTKNTSKGKMSAIGNLLIKLFLVVFVLFFGVIVLNKIDFPAPNKEIKKIIPNENFKTIK